MFGLDFRTVLLTATVTDFICTLVVAALWHQARGRFHGLGLLAASFACQSLAVPLIALRGAIPAWSSIVLANALIIGGAIIGLSGLERFVGRQRRILPGLILMSAFLAIHAFFTYGFPHLTARNINFTLALGLLCCRCAWLLLRVDGPLRATVRPVGLIYAFYSLVCCVRLGWLAVHLHAAGDFLRPGVFEESVHLVFQMLFVLLTYALVLMVNRRLLSELRVLDGLLPICAHCKKVRDDQGYWNQIESYIESRTEAEFSHGICPACMQELYPHYRRIERPG